MIEIDGQLTCIIEALERCIGQQKITNVVQQNNTTYYVFEDGHKLPLLCGCCGAPLIFKNLVLERRVMPGYMLAGIEVITSTLENGEEFDELVLEFSKPGLNAGVEKIEVAIETPAHLIHPAPARRKEKLAFPKKRKRLRRKKSPQNKYPGKKKKKRTR